MKKIKLKPCPFCGTDLLVGPVRSVLGWRVSCSWGKQNHSADAWSKTKEGVIRLWNRRAK